jgi:hypothetical protein
MAPPKSPSAARRVVAVFEVSRIEAVMMFSEDASCASAQVM